MKTILWLILVIFCFKVSSQNINSVKNHLQTLHEDGKFNAVVMIMQNDSIVYQDAFGVVDKDSSDLLNTQTIFRLGSVSKQFTAVAIMMLEEQGKLSFKDDIKKYFPNAPYEGVTIHHLLTHTSGLPDYMRVCEKHFNPKLPRWDYNRLIQEKDTVFKMLFKHSPRLLFPVGKKYKYCNTGYIMLASIIEKVANEDFKFFMKKNIFQPLKMNNTQVYDYHPGDTSSVTNKAVGFWKKNEREIHEAEHNFMNRINDGAGSIISNLDDLAKWERALSSKSIISDSIKAKALTGYVHMNGSRYYSYGWVVKTENGVLKFAAHDGKWLGYRSFVMRDLKTKSCIVLLTNDSGVTKISAVTEIHRLFLRKQDHN